MRAIHFFLVLFLGTLAFAQIGPARASFEREDYTSADTEALTELSREPGNYEAYEILSLAMLAREEYEEALKYGKEGLAIRGDSMEMVAAVGISSFYLGRNEEALGHFNHYIRRAPLGERIHLIYFYTGEVYIRQQQWQKADIALSSALYHSPTMGSWWVKLGSLRLNKEAWIRAGEAFQEALELDPSNEEARRGIQAVESALAQS
jgi:tetratricopeptide (TPR) repeat protein